MNKKLGQLRKAYKPKKRKKLTKNKPAKAPYRSLSPRRQASLAEPTCVQLPAIKTPKLKQSGYESDMQRLEDVINRNEFARNGLFRIRSRVMELGYAYSRKRMQSLDGGDELLAPNFLKLPPIDG